MTFEELVNLSLIGTSRGGAPATVADGALGDAVRSAVASSPEEQLLSAATLVAAYETCGAVPAPAESPASRAGADQHAVCSPRAADLLAQLLSMPNAPLKQQLVSLWLDHAAGVRCRPPHRLLPNLLDYGAANRAVRAGIGAVIDERGRWLMSLNRSWQFTAAEQEDVESIWQTGQREQRAAALRRKRESDAAGARSLVQSSWKEDGADERAAFVEVMRVGLSLEDEPFLESALDDRSKLVRAAAADLLSRLPGSALVRRMIERVEPLLAFQPGQKGGLLKKAKPDAIAVTLPPDQFDKSWERDGITEKADERIGRRQWWLLQMLRAVPPPRWSDKWQRSPTQVVAAAASGEFADILLRAWADAAGRSDDRDWAAAVVNAYVEGGRERLPVSLLSMLPPEGQRSMVVKLFETQRVEPPVLLEALGALSVELGLEEVRRVINAIAQLGTKTTGGYNYYAGAMLERLSFAAPPAMHDELATQLSGGWDQNRKAVDAFLQTIQLRRDIEREFAT